MESAETHLRDGIGRLRAFSGFQEEFDGLYEELRKAVVDIYKNKPDQPLPPHLQQLENEFHQTALEARQLMKERIRHADRSTLLHSHQLTRRKVAGDGQEGDQVSMMANEVSVSLQRMNRTMHEEIDKSILSYQILERSTKKLKTTNEKYSEFGGILGNTSTAIKNLWKRERSDQFWIGLALAVFVAAAAHIVVSRLWVPPGWIISVPIKWTFEAIKAYRKNPAAPVLRKPKRTIATRSSTIDLFLSTKTNGASLETSTPPTMYQQTKGETNNTVAARTETTIPSLESQTAETEVGKPSSVSFTEKSKAILEVESALKRTESKKDEQVEITVADDKTVTAESFGEIAEAPSEMISITTQNIEPTAVVVENKINVTTAEASTVTEAIHPKLEKSSAGFMQAELHRPEDVHEIQAENVPEKLIVGSGTTIVTNSEIPVDVPAQLDPMVETVQDNTETSLKTTEPVALIKAVNVEIQPKPYDHNQPPEIKGSIKAESAFIDNHIEVEHINQNPPLQTSNAADGREVVGEDEAMGTEVGASEPAEALDDNEDYLDDDDGQGDLGSASSEIPLITDAFSTLASQTASEEIFTDKKEL